MTTTPPRNQLANEDSPYLLQHADNPVDWLAWGEPAFARARAEDKPVFLSIGYSTCHWCHVMAHESFENPAIAAFLNAHFVCIKVDREERPDVDLTYMTYVQATTGHGGWPMSVFLTPQALPFFGGTYFPPDDRYGRTGFLHLIERIAELWQSQRDDLSAQAERALAELQAQARATPEVAAGLPDAAQLAKLTVASFAKQFDREHGGFGGAPKFPRPAATFFLLECARLLPDTTTGKQALAMAQATLRAIAAGGIHDHLGGGFHRYAVDRIWHIPHYEKMLYDQAQLIPLFVEADRLAGSTEFRTVIDAAVAYVTRELAHPGGGFFSAEDADSLPSPEAGHKREGAFYVFTAEEIARVLAADDAAVFCTAYGVQPAGNADPASDPHGELSGTNTLFRACDTQVLAQRHNRGEAEIEDMLAAARAAMLEHRATRPRPHRDEKVIAGWNGLMISALACAGRVLQRPDWIQRAIQAATFVHRQLWDAANARLFRSFRDKHPVIPAFASDYTQLIRGLLDLYSACGETRWLDWAITLHCALERDHLDTSDGTYFSARADGALGVLSLKDDHDGAEPSPNSLAALNLLTLAELLDAPDYQENARRMLGAQAEQLKHAPHVAPVLAAAALRLAHPAGRLLIAASDHPDAAAFIAATRGIGPDMPVVLLPADGPERAWWLARHPWLASLPSTGQAPAAFTCRNQTCSAPIHDAARLVF